MSNRKYICKNQQQITGSLIPGMDTAINVALNGASAALSWLGNVVWDCIKFLGITGLTALRDLIVDLWKDGTKRTIKTDNLKKFIVLIKRKLLKKNAEYRKDKIFADLSELNKLCFYIEKLNEEGMEKNQQTEIKKLAATHIKNILKQFKKLMSASDEKKPEEKPKDEKKPEEKPKDEKPKDDKPKEEDKKETKKTTNRRYRK